jgi:hypothetical protein
MNTDEKYLDPYSNKDFWIKQLSTKSRSELEGCLLEFDRFAAEVENEYRVALSPNRAQVCREALEELLKSETRRTKDLNQGELFNCS